MPHKKNPIRLEQIEGLARLAKGFMIAITENIKTWEERSIEQSCVERVAWPDLFHLIVRGLDVLNMVLAGITIYRDHMLREIIESRGVYASGEVKEFLKEKLEPFGLGYENCYRLVQLACFNVFEVSKKQHSLRVTVPSSLFDADTLLLLAKKTKEDKIISIEDFIPQGNLRVSEQLVPTDNDVAGFNKALKELFASSKIKQEWHELFKISFLLKNENILFEKILND